MNVSSLFANFLHAKSKSFRRGTALGASRLTPPNIRSPSDSAAPVRFEQGKIADKLPGAPYEISNKFALLTKNCGERYIIMQNAKYFLSKCKLQRSPPPAAFSTCACLVDDADCSHLYILVTLVMQFCLAMPPPNKAGIEMEMHGLFLVVVGMRMTHHTIIIFWD